jgi:hypothetical protein
MSKEKLIAGLLDVEEMFSGALTGAVEVLPPSWAEACALFVK